MQQFSNINPALLDFDNLPNSQRALLPIVKALFDISSATVWRMVKAKQLNTYKFTERTTAFNVDELRARLSIKVEG